MNWQLRNALMFGAAFLVIYHLLGPLVLDAERSSVLVIVSTTLVAVAMYYVGALLWSRRRQ